MSTILGTPIKANLLCYGLKIQRRRDGRPRHENIRIERPSRIEIQHVISGRSRVLIYQRMERKLQPLVNKMPPYDIGTSNRFLEPGPKIDVFANDGFAVAHRYRTLTVAENVTAIEAESIALAQCGAVIANRHPHAEHFSHGNRADVLPANDRHPETLNSIQHARGPSASVRPRVSRAVTDYQKIPVIRDFPVRQYRIQSF